MGAERGLGRGLGRGLERGLERGMGRGLERGMGRGLERGVCVQWMFGELVAFNDAFDYSASNMIGDFPGIFESG